MAPTESQSRAGTQASIATRAARRDLKRRIKNGQVAIKEVLHNPSGDPVIAKSRISDLIQAIPGIGQARTAKILNTANIMSSRRVRGLGNRQRDMLICLIHELNQ